MQKYDLRYMILVDDDGHVLDLSTHIDMDKLHTEVENGAVVIWNYKGLRLLLSNAALKNYLRHCDAAKKLRMKSVCLIPEQFVILPLNIATLLVGDND